MIIGHFTWYGAEKYRGLEMLCDFCNEYLHRPHRWYYRANLTDEYASWCICTNCAKKMDKRVGLYVETE